MKKQQKRYQYFSKEGIKWTEWFDFNGDPSNKIQFKSGKTILKNEYREIDDEETN